MTFKQIIFFCVVVCVLCVAPFIIGCREDCSNHGIAPDAQGRYDIQADFVIEGREYDTLETGRVGFTKAVEIESTIQKISRCIDKVNWDDINYGMAQCEFSKRKNELGCISSVIVTNKYQLSCDQQVQLLSAERANFVGCKQKGFEFNEECPCLYRGVIQDDSAIVLPPDMKVLKWLTVQYLSQCRRPDLDEQLQECLR